MKKENRQLFSPRSFSIALSPLLFALLIALSLRWGAQGQGDNSVTTVSAASFTSALAPDAIAAAFGSKLATRTEIATSAPLPTTLAGTTVKVNGVLAPLFFVSPTQINYLIPTNTTPGNVPVMVTSGDGTVSTGTVQVSNVAPAIFTANASGTGLPAAVLLRLTAGGQQIFERIDQPLVFKQEGDRLFLLLYLSGVRRAAPGTVKALVAGSELPTEFAVAPGFVGLDQVNVELPLYLSGRGRINLQIKAGNALSNIVEIEMGGPDLRTATTTAVTSSANPAVAGQEVVFTVRVSAAGNARIPTGNLMLAENSMMIGQKTLDNAGQASFTYVLTSTGGRNIAASYEGDNFFKASNGALSAQQSVNKAQATVTLSSSANPATLAQVVTLTAEVRPVSPSTITPTGIVQFKESNVPLGTPITLVNGLAGFSVSTLALGARNITAEYYGDPNFQPVSSSTYTQTVGTAPLQITGITRPTLVYASEEITINGSGFTATPADHEVKVIADDGKETTGQVINAAADQLRVRIPFGAGSGKVKVIVGGREVESTERMEIGTSVSGFVQEFKDGARIPVIGLPVALREVSGRRIETVTNNDGSFILKAATPALLSFIEINGQTANGLSYPAQVRKMRVLASRDNQYSSDGDLANIIEVKPNSTISTGTIVADAPTNETLSVAAPASPEEIAGQITNAQVTFDTNNSTISFPPGSNNLTLTVLDPRRTPANLPVGRFSSTIAQITPFGATLTPGGKVTFPNSDGISTGTAVRVFRFDQATNNQTLGQFIDIGAATISADGTKIETAANAVMQTSYYFVSRQWPTATIIGHVIETDGRPVRRAVVTARGQSVFTDNNGGFVLANVPVITPDGFNDQVTIEISYVRADGRVSFTQRSVTINANDSLAINQDFALPRQQINRQPQIMAPASVAVTEGETRDFNIIVTDPDGQAVTVTVVGAGFATLLNQGNGIYTLRLTPGQNSAGAYTLLLNAGDSAGLTSMQNVSVVVQRASNSNPTANYISATTNEDTAVGITLSAKSPNGAALSYTVVSNPAHGTLSGFGANRSYAPAPDYNGLDSFSYKVNDGSRESNVATVFIVVKPVNDAPVLTFSNSASSLSVNAGETVKIDLTGADVDEGQTLSFTITNAPPGATFAQARPTSWQFSWTPIFTQQGSNVVTFKVSDDGSPVLTDTKTVTIIVDAKWAKTSGPEGGDVRSFVNVGNILYAGTSGGGVYRSADNGRGWSPINNGLSGYGLYVNALLTNGNDLYAGTLNGVYRSTNNGQSWEPFSNGLSSGGLFVHALLANGNDLYTGTLNGVYRSTNNGQSWTLASNGLSGNGLYVNALAANNTGLYAGTGGSGIYHSTDNGQNWTPVNNGVSGNGLDVRALLANGTNLYAGTGGSGVYRSTDNGQSWTPSTTGLINPFVQTLAVYGNNLFAGTGFVVYRSADNGQSWTFASSGLLGGAVYALLANGPSLYAGTNGSGVYRSTDNGQNWAQTSSGFTASFVTAQVSTGSSLYAGTTRGLYRSTDNGQSWTLVSNGLPDTVYVGALLANGTSLYAGTSGVYRSTDGGQNWTPISNGLPSGIVYALLINGTYLYAGILGGGVYRSTNNGQNWTPVNNGLSGNGLYVLALLANGTSLYAGTEGGGIYRLTDDEESWTPVNNGLPYYGLYVRALVANGTGLYAGTAGGVYRSTDNGKGWSPASNSISGIRALLTNGTAMYVGTDASGGVYRSTNNGQSWTRVGSSLDNGGVFSLAFHGPDLFVGTQGNGVHRLTNNVQSWTPSTAGLTNPFVNTVAVSGPNLFAGTLGGGVFRSSDSGQSWTPVNTGLPKDTAGAYSSVNTFAQSGANLFAGTYGDGIYRSTDQGQSWTSANSGLANKYVTSLAVSGATLFAGTVTDPITGTPGGVFRSDNQGLSWTSVNVGLTNLVVLSLAVNGNNLFAGTDGGGVFVSDNQGQTWTAASTGLTARGVSSLGFSGTTLFAGTLSGGIFRSTNNGQSWTPINNNLPQRLPVFTFAASGSKLYAGTVYGVFLSEDSGASWKQINAGLLDIYTTSLAVSGKTLIAGTRVGGVFTSQIP